MSEVQYADYQPKHIGEFAPGVTYTTAAECFRKWPQVALVSWKRYVGQGKCGATINHKGVFYVTLAAATEFAASKGWTS